MNARIGDIIAGSSAVLMAVALIGVLIGLWAEVAPGAALMVMFALGAIGVAAETVRRYEHGAARQQSSTQSLLDMRRRRAELALHEQTEQSGDAVPPVLIAA